MKKTFAVLFLISFFATLAVPLISSAANTSQCCKITRSFTLQGETWSGGTCYTEVAATDSPVCVDLNGNALCSAVIATTRANWGLGCILNTIYRVVDVIFAILIIVAVLMILLAAYTFMSAGGKPEQVNSARNYILFAIVGVIVAFFARILPSIVASLL